MRNLVLVAAGHFGGGCVGFVFGGELGVLEGVEKGEYAKRDERSGDKYGDCMK